MNKNETGPSVATVVGLCIYPVKSMAGVTVEKCRIGWHGLDGDRRIAFLKLGDRSGFPWLTQRDIPSMSQYKPHFLQPTDLRKSEISVVEPGGLDLGVFDPKLRELLSSQHSEAIHVMQVWSGVYDTMEISLISRQTIDEISRRADMASDWRRFRTNIVLDVANGQPFTEDSWLKGLLVFGQRENSARLRMYRRDERCMIVNIDPDSGRQEPNMLKTIVRERKNCCGVYGNTSFPGTVELGDSVYLERHE